MQVFSGGFFTQRENDAYFTVKNKKIINFQKTIAFCIILL
jgi:hypothetical protein